MCRGPDEVRIECAVLGEDGLLAVRGCGEGKLLGQGHLMEELSEHYRDFHG